MPSLFLALFPPADVAHRIVADAAAHPALANQAHKIIAPERLHITLAYLGDRGHDEHCIAAVSGVLAGFSGVPADTEFSVLRSFGESGVRPIVVTGRYDNPDVVELRAMLLPELERAGVAVEIAHEFVPHVTIAYADVDLPLGHAGPYCPQCTEILLVRGGDYAVLARRALPAPPVPAGAWLPWYRDPCPSGRELTPEELEELRPIAPKRR
jgi:2'-5' RNA ligase